MTGTVIECRFCGHVHGPRCPSVKAIEYYENGTVRRVEFLTAQDYSNPAHIPTVWPPIKQPPGLWPTASSVSGGSL